MEHKNITDPGIGVSIVEGSERESLVRRWLDPIFLGPWLLLIMFLLLLLVWCSLPYNVLPQLRLPFDESLLRDKGMEEWINRSFGNKIGYWIDYMKWDKGPPSEYAYDFVLEIHLALSLLVYVVIIQWIRFRGSSRSNQVDQRISQASRLLLVYPFLCSAVYLFFPWNDDSMVQQMLSLLLYIPLLCSSAYLAIASFSRWQTRFIQLVCLICSATLINDIVKGDGLYIFAVMHVGWALTIWALMSRPCPKSYVEVSS